MAMVSLGVFLAAGGILLARVRLVERWFQCCRTRPSPAKPNLALSKMHGAQAWATPGALHPVAIAYPMKALANLDLPYHPPIAGSWAEVDMSNSVFLETEFFLLVLFSVVIPSGIYGFLLKRKAIARWSVLAFVDPDQPSQRGWTKIWSGTGCDRNASLATWSLKMSPFQVSTAATQS